VASRSSATGRRHPWREPLHGAAATAARTAVSNDGQLVIVNYYSLKYADPASTAASQALNQAMDTAAAPFDVRVADGFGAFQTAAVQAGGDSCAAGLPRSSRLEDADASERCGAAAARRRGRAGGGQGLDRLIAAEMLRMCAVSCFREPSGVCLMGR
jgi:hypothetical protein